MRMHMGMDMCVDVCMGTPCRPVAKACVDVFTDICVALCMGMRTDVCMDE